MKKYGITLGLLIMLVSGICFSCGCVSQPEPETVYQDKIVYQDRIEYINTGYSTMEVNKMISERDAEWELIREQDIKEVTLFVENRDQEWRQACEASYQVGYNDASSQTITDLADILSTVGFLLI